MTNCHRSKNRFAEGLKNEQADSIELDLTENDSFTVVYRQSVNGYKVKAMVRMSHYDTNYAGLRKESLIKYVTFKTNK